MLGLKLIYTCKKGPRCTVYPMKYAHDITVLGFVYDTVISEFV